MALLLFGAEFTREVEAFRPADHTRLARPAAGALFGGQGERLTIFEIGGGIAQCAAD